MLSQFLSRYPSGNLISELLQIHEGQFVVQVKVQVEGITRATGLAAAENLELAEDRARKRALMVLGGDAKSPFSVASQTTAANGIELEPTFVAVAASKWSETKSLPSLGATPQETLTLSLPVSAAPEARSDRPPTTTVTPMPASEKTLEKHLDLGDDFSEASSEEAMGSLKSEVLPELYTKQSYEEIGSELEQVEPVAVALAKEPADMSDILAQTSIELQRLGWTTQKGRNYLKKTYGKASRQQLTEVEMFEFLAYLRSQPTPNPLPFES